MMTMQKQNNLDPLPKGGQVWKTQRGHLVRVITSARPGPQEIIETAYMDGRIDGHLGANFHLDGSAVMSDDALVELVYSVQQYKRTPEDDEIMDDGMPRRLPDGWQR